MTSAAQDHAIGTAPSEAPTAAPRGRAILIVGMHRSGTSALAGLMNHLGIDVPGDLIPPAFDNPKGFFENRRFVQFDDRLLGEIGFAYDDAVRIPDDTFRTAVVGDAVDRLRRLALHELGDAPQVLVKDPRICRLLPVWIPALEGAGRTVATLHPLRDPFEVAQSLHKRNEFPLEQGLLLWLSHVLAAERDSRGRPRSFLMFDAVMGDWRAVATRIAADLDLSWPRTFEDAAPAVEDFLSSDLRHHAAQPRPAAAPGTLEALVDETWNALAALIDRADDPDAMARLDAVSAALAGAENVFRGYVHGANRLLEQRYDRIDALEQHAAHMDHVVRTQAAEAEAELASERNQTERWRHESERWEVQSGNLTSERDALRGLSDELRDDRDRLHHSLQQVLGSFSWRAGAPLRRLAERMSPATRKRLRAGLRPAARLARGMVRPRSVALPPVAQRVIVSEGRETEDVVQRHSEQEMRQAETILRSPFFDPAFYAGETGLRLSGIDAALHYVIDGEAARHRPSPRFDPVFYARRYPDLADAVPNLLVHFVLHGAAEGRAGTSAAQAMTYPEARFDPARRTVLVIAHEASRTGAPILAWNIAERFHRTHNVVTLIMAGGEFETTFAEAADVALGPVGRPACFDPLEAEAVIHEITRRYRIDFAIANSVETRDYAVALERAGVPTIALVHEFSTYYRPPGLLHALYETASRLVFPARVVHEVSRLEYEAVRKRVCDIVPQGPSLVPVVSGVRTKGAVNDPKLPSILRPPGFEDAFLVLGMGTVQHRKGVDLFVAAALAARRCAPERKFRFLWIGHGYKPSEDLHFSVYVHAQIELSGLDDCLDIIDNVADLEPVYERMDALLLPSRLDPLPNVSIDAALRGVPVVCFDGATGMSDILAEGEAARDLVAPHLDAHMAGAELARLATDRAHYDAVAADLSAIARRTFDMDVYVGRLAALGEEVIAAATQAGVDRDAIAAEPDLFEPDFYVGEVLPGLDRKAALGHYVAASARRGRGRMPEAYAYPRRPVPGFNPLRFEAEHPGLARDPLAEYAALGRPAGPWRHPVIRADAPTPAAPPAAMRVALHGHFHYPELLPEFLGRLSANALACDLFLTTDTAEALTALRGASRGYAKGRVELLQVPNRGRDIAPFLTALGPGTLRGYDLVGHLHGKRSLHTVGVDPTYGERWRTFLWEHLLGDAFPMADRIAAAFDADPALGLVFPEDPNLVGWDGGREVASGLAARMGVASPLPHAFDFPNGTMFWARPAALEPLFALGLATEDYPPEPLPKDGTLLHALERLLPFSAEAAGYTVATTLVPGSVR
ncbi:glycosyltransferase [Aureimonas flava]|uniref:Glycosyltransferase n=1 Tax=Aureimonas flava TaxID=2320271 RepID=A0A3A1WNC6_9HYPH|nr:rhamnan synthesis F family protein [Aureimonas flava]RIY01373.1 glycosyltransferase [Aureimonas flava]